MIQTQNTEVGMLQDEHLGNFMERKEREEQPAVAGARDRKQREKQPAVAGARDTVTPGGHNGRGQGVQTRGNGPPQARIGAHGNEANNLS